jgi:hypothetical protein
VTTRVEGRSTWSGRRPQLTGSPKDNSDPRWAQAITLGTIQGPKSKPATRKLTKRSITAGRHVRVGTKIDVKVQ